MDNRRMYVQQAVDTVFTIRARDENKQRKVVGLQGNYQAEVHFERATGEIVGVLSSSAGDFAFFAETVGGQEGLQMTFYGEKTETWNLKPDFPGVVFDEETSQPRLGREELYGTLLVRDAVGTDVEGLSGANLALVIEASTTLGFSIAPQEVNDLGGTSAA